MIQVNVDKLKEIKSRIAAMIEERANGNGKPSKIWADSCGRFQYLLDLPEKYYADLRYHTWHLTGDHYQTYAGGEPEKFVSMADLETHAREMPSKYTINEPEGGIGFRYPNGRFLNNDILRYQTVIIALYHSGILPALPGKGASERNLVLEIGGGYGALAHHLSKIVDNITYVIVDLPETLIFSSSYLHMQNPGKKIYLYNKIDFSEFIHSAAVKSYDFILLPNYVLPSLRHLHFELAVNIASFQEMRSDQVAGYLDFIRETCRGALYSWNQDRHPENEELKNVSQMLEERFLVTELHFPRDLHPMAPGKILKKIRSRIGRFLEKLGRPPHWFPPYRQLLCTPK